MQFKYIPKRAMTFFNQKIIAQYGGICHAPSNIKNASTLDYLLEIVQQDTYLGAPLYSTIEKKAALYIFKINQSHIFWDGNKRTSFATMNFFLHENGYELQPNLQSPFHQTPTNNIEILEHIFIGMAAGDIQYEDIVNFIALNIQKIAPNYA